jgi:hypothetical protein
MRAAIALVLALTSLLAPRAASSAAPAPEQSFAVVVGNNVSHRAEDPVLHYADDDAARWHRTLSALGARSTLFTRFDAASQARFPDLIAAARAPRRRELLDHVASLAADLERAGREGTRTRLYFVFTGHGRVDSLNRGHLDLEDHPLTRADLFDAILARLTATTVHVIVDACDAWYFVAARGEPPRPSAVDLPLEGEVRAFLARRELARHPAVGVFVSSAGRGRTHEWSEIASGLFSHALLSALAGAADADADGRVTYPEAAAYVAASLARIPRTDLAPRFYARPPAADLGAPLADVTQARAMTRLALDAAEVGRFHVEDGRGVRLLDLHKAAGAAAQVMLVGAAPFHVFHDGRAARVEAGEGGPIVAAARLEWLARAAGGARARGAVDDALASGYFATPFSADFVAGHGARLAAEWARDADEAAEAVGGPRAADLRVGVLFDETVDGRAAPAPVAASVVQAALLQAGFQVVPGEDVEALRRALPAADVAAGRLPRDLVSVEADVLLRGAVDATLLREGLLGSEWVAAIADARVDALVPDAARVVLSWTQRVKGHHVGREAALRDARGKAAAALAEAVATQLLAALALRSEIDLTVRGAPDLATLAAAAQRLVAAGIVAGARVARYDANLSKVVLHAGAGADAERVGTAMAALADAPWCVEATGGRTVRARWGGGCATAARVHVSGASLAPPAVPVHGHAWLDRPAGRLTLRNPSSQVAHAVRVAVVVSDATHGSGEVDIGDLAPGAVREVPLYLTRAADGTLAATTPKRVTARVTVSHAEGADRVTAVQSVPVDLVE